MLGEALTDLTARAAPGARAAGLVHELAGIGGRYRRHKKAWQPHLQHTKECITAHLYQADKAEPVLLIGAGLGLDVPLDALNAHPAGALLMDAVETLSLRWKLRRYPNIRFERFDVTGLLAPYAHTEEGAALHPPAIAPLPLVGYGMAVSCNILSQLPLAFADSPPADEDERALTAAIQKAHVKALMAMGCPALLITDYARIETKDDGHRHVIPTVERSFLPGDPLETWDWHIAPKGEAAPDLDISLKVGAWLLNAYC
ncbi:hypothetical protein [Kordiimonas marina]|uniref:hypothetical protein n=1 Tax=Kordiimonas marina TaxID=2872312 RepID=UPI001FF4DDE6|nr:hypothetical protein [Kordiimonas marina]MCJ9428495.1 hypothetical protein [Kordiimonas marina]